MFSVLKESYSEVVVNLFFSLLCELLRSTIAGVLNICNMYMSVQHVSSSLDLNLGFIYKCIDFMIRFVSHNLLVVGQLYGVHKIIVRCVCPSDRVHLSLFLWFVGQF